MFVCASLHYHGNEWYFKELLLQHKTTIPPLLDHSCLGDEAKRAVDYQLWRNIASGEELLFACIVGYNIEWIFPWKRNIIMPLKKSIAGCWLSRPRWMVVSMETLKYISRLGGNSH